MGPYLYCFTLRIYSKEELLRYHTGYYLSIEGMPRYISSRRSFENELKSINSKNELIEFMNNFFDFPGELVIGEEGSDGFDAKEVLKDINDLQEIESIEFDWHALDLTAFATFGNGDYESWIMEVEHNYNFCNKEYYLSINEDISPEFIKIAEMILNQEL